MAENLVGKRFGRLVVLADCGLNQLCACDCGHGSLVLRCNLVTKNTLSCGCLRREIEVVASLTHGETRAGKWTRIYNIWHGMIQRCCNPSNPNWPRYGGRGITVCDEWRSSFAAFKRDMGEPPYGRSLDRKDNNGPYCKSNCVWATIKEQNRNRRDNLLLTFAGTTMPLSAWAEELGKNYWTLRTRLKLGWTVERILCV